MAQLKQDMKGSKRIFSTDATDTPSIRLPAVDQASQSIRPITGLPPSHRPFQHQGSLPPPVQGSNSPRISFMVWSPRTYCDKTHDLKQDTSAASLNTSRIYAHFPAPPILVAPPPSPPPQPPDRTQQPNATALEVGTRTNTVLLAPTARTGTPPTSSLLGRPNEDLNRFVSTSTVSGTTLTAGSSGSFVKHPGPAQITRIGPEDVPSLPERVGKMVFDKVMMRWVKAAVVITPRIPEGGGDRNAASSEIDAESEDPFRDIESLREDSLAGDDVGEHMPPSTDNSSIDEVGDEEEMELTSFSFDGPSHSHARATIGGEDDTTDSDNDDEDVTEISALSASLSLAGPPEIAFDQDSSDEEVHRERAVTFVKGTSGPSREMPVPTPIRSALKGATTSPAVSFVDPLVSIHCTPASKPGHRRSVSFSDGKREGPIRGLGRGTYAASLDHEPSTNVPVGETSFEPSARSKRIGEILDGLESTVEYPLASHIKFN
jgi:protein NUD1